MSSSELYRLLELYGASPGVDPGPDEVYSTADVLSLMAARQAEKEREPYEALTRLFTTAMVPMAATHAASGNLPKAISRHIAQEVKNGNPNATPFTSPFLASYLVAATPAAHRALAAIHEAAQLGPAALRAAPDVKTGFMAGHALSTARMLEHLNRTEPTTTTLYSRPSSGVLANAAEQKPTAGITPRTERAAALERGRDEFRAQGPQWLESGERLSPLGSEGGGAPKYHADLALRRTGGAYDKALALLADNPEAVSVLRYWREAGYHFRPYADPLRAQNYWKGTDELRWMEPPTRALSQDANGRFYDKNRMNAHPSSSLPGAAATTPQQNLEDLLNQYGSQF